jgi:acetyltransferase-like isoleucine patch superfamily enzyme
MKNIKFERGKLIFVDKDGNSLNIRIAIGKIFNRFFNYYLDFCLYIINAVSSHVPFWTIRRLIFRVSGLKIGNGSVIHMGARFFYPKNIEIGQDSIVGNDAFLDGRAKLKVGNHVDIASEVLIYNSEHDIESETFAAIEEPVIVEDYTFIGPRAIILPGVRVSKGSIVAAGAVVTKSTEDGFIYGGVPARVIGERKLKNYKYNLGRSRLFQ